jgi:hypothetical protein
MAPAKCAGSASILGNLDAARLAQLGVADAAGLDVRQYLVGRCREWGGTPENLRHPAWRGRRWLEDPVWRAYLIYRALSHDPGLGFYGADSGRPNLLPPFAALVDGVPTVAVGPGVTAPQVPWTVGLTLYHDPAARRVFVDLNNTRIDLATNVITATPPLAFRVTLPTAWAGSPVSARLLAPGPAPGLRVRPVGTGQVEVEIDPFLLYACLVLEPVQPGAAPGVDRN